MDSGDSIRDSFLSITTPVTGKQGVCVLVCVCVCEVYDARLEMTEGSEQGGTRPVIIVLS